MRINNRKELSRAVINEVLHRESYKKKWQVKLSDNIDVSATYIYNNFRPKVIDKAKIGLKLVQKICNYYAIEMNVIIDNKEYQFDELLSYIIENHTEKIKKFKEYKLKDNTTKKGAYLLNVLKKFEINYHIELIGIESEQQLEKVA